MAGFIRRFGFFPGSEVITRIEGTVIVDLPPPGSVEGVDAGVVGVVGEFADCSYAIQVSSTGAISTKIRPVEVFSAQDMLNKVGGFDETLGDFGTSDGNGFVTIRNKKFSRLVVVPINLASSQGARVTRQLPLCTSATDTSPVVPLQAANVAAGREFRNGLGRVRLAQRVNFTARAPIVSGITGSIAPAVAAATQTFTAVGFDWAAIARPDGNLGARKGDIVVIGYDNAGAAAPTGTIGAGGAGTYRVASDPGAGTTVSLQKLVGGATWTWATTTTDLPWRLHFGTDADSAPEKVAGSANPGGYALADAGGAVVAIRPLTDSAGAQTNGTYAVGTLLTPAVAPPAFDASNPDALTELYVTTHPTVVTPFTVAVQGLNAPQSATMDAAYVTAIDSLEADEDPTRDVNILLLARTSVNIRAKAKSHVIAVSGQGVGRMACIRPELTVRDLLTARGDTGAGVGVNRAERVIYNWPGVQSFIPEAVGYNLSTSDASVTADGVLDLGSDAWMASLLSNLPPERNPGQAGAPVPLVMSTILGLQRGVTGLGMNEYTTMRDRGIAGPRMDRRVGPIFQSGITTSLTSGQKNINRRRMADFIEDSLANRLVEFSKDLDSTQLRDTAAGEVDAFLSELLSVDNAAARRIADYQIDDKSGNTPEMSAKGIYVIIVRVRTLATADFIVLQCEIGEGVTISSLAA